jgi:molybdate transport system substrate-binding protein
VNALRILSGGAAQGLIAGLVPKFEAATGWTLAGDFGAVGGMAARLRSGEAVDAIVLTQALVDALKGEGIVVANSIRPVGLVETALAVRACDAVAPIADVGVLSQTLLMADAIFVPDTKASTAGAHVAKVLQQLGIADRVASRLKVFPNGATAMRELAASQAQRPVGCTQATEILATPGLQLVGALPGEFALSTIYSAAITTRAADATIARSFVQLLTAHDQLAARARAGFLEPSRE